METKNITITYDHEDAVEDVEAALATVQALLYDGIFSMGREEANSKIGAAYLMSQYERIQTLLWSIERQLGRASQVLSNEVY